MLCYPSPLSTPCYCIELQAPNQKDHLPIPVHWKLELILQVSLSCYWRGYFAVLNICLLIFLKLRQHSTIDISKLSKKVQSGTNDKHKEICRRSRRLLSVNFIQTVYLQFQYIDVQHALLWPPNKLFLQVCKSGYANLISGHTSLQSPTGK